MSRIGDGLLFVYYRILASLIRMDGYYAKSRSALMVNIESSFESLETEIRDTVEVLFCRTIKRVT